MTNELTEARKELESALARVKILEEQAPKPQGISFVPEINCTYCWIDVEGYANSSMWTNDGADNCRLEIGNVYPPDGKLAKIIVENRKTLVKLRKYAFEPDWNDDEQRKWTFEVADGDVSYDCYFEHNSGSPVYFPSEQNIEAARAEVGDDAIRQLWDYGVV